MEKDLLVRRISCSPDKKKIERLITGYWGMRVVETGNNPTYKKLKILV